MDALILAAGLGTRLRPLTDRTPKILIEVGGEPLLVRTVRYLAEAGVDRIVINTHHLAGLIEQFVAEHDLGIEIAISFEPDRPLDTGGGVYHARDLLRRDRPFVLMNGDIITDVDLEAMITSHDPDRALATLAVHDRTTTRRLRFDEQGLYGRVDDSRGLIDGAREPVGDTVERAFAGLHIVSPALFDLIVERGAFPILPLYLRLTTEGQRIAPFDVTGAMWLEIGNPTRLAEARRVLGR